MKYPSISLEPLEWGWRNLRYGKIYPFRIAKPVRPAVLVTQ